MTALEQIAAYQLLWVTVIPHLPPPPPEDVARWFAFEPSAVERAIVRAARRFSPEKLAPNFDPVEAYRYTTALARTNNEHNSTTSNASPTEGLN